MDAQRHILLVEDDDSEREALARALRFEGYRITAVRNPRQAMEQASDQVDLVVTDLRMGQQTGIDLLRSWRVDRPKTPFLVLTAFGTVETAVEAMKLGALDFLPKPVDPQRLLHLIDRSLQSCIDVKRGDAPRGVDRIIGQAMAIRQVRAQILKAAKSNSTVLVMGESGTGKELVAEAIHYHSQRAAGPLVAVNMAAVPEALVESEWFGHVKGAFTSAVASHSGRFVAAHGGTLFIDEVGDLPRPMQSKLLRVLETRTVMPIGGDRETAVDVRVVAATSRPLQQMIQAGDFREDLYYRLNVVAIQLPPLRERKEDVPFLVRHFLAENARASGGVAPEVAPELIEVLSRYDWPGNVRQLKNCLESMCVLSNSQQLTSADLPPDLRSLLSLPAEDQEGRLNSLKKQAILDALRQFAGNRTQAAAYLGISIRTLQRKLREWGMGNTVGGQAW